MFSSKKTSRNSVSKMLRCLHLRPRAEEAIHSRQIDKQLEELHQQFESAIKILLLGTAESGKTTIIKQMKILHIDGFTDEERKEKIYEICQNIHESLYELVRHMDILQFDYDNLSNAKSGEFILSFGRDGLDYIDEIYRDHALALWSDGGIRGCFERSNEFPLPDSTKYFLDSLERISNEDYIPSTEDILFSRKITTGIHQIRFTVKIPKSMGGGLQEFRMFDVGGQRDQRNKWIQVFEGIQAVLFLISCADFDQTLREDPMKNRLTEALELFRGVWLNRFLSSAGVIVFLNKQDIMERKIRAGKRIGDYFPEYQSFRNCPKSGNYFDECDWTKKFIQQKLINITAETPKRLSRLDRYHSHQRECYYHFTVATDTSNIRTVFSDVHSMILTDNLSAIGLL